MYQICKQYVYVTDSVFDLADEIESGKMGKKEHFTSKEPLIII